MAEKYKIMLVVGEISGDSHAAKLVEEMRAISPQAEFEFFGATGKRMREAGVETIVRADDFARVGIIEVAKALPMFWRIFRKIKKTALARRPDAVVLVDFPDFNLRLAKALKKKGLKIIYYVSPQVWAWKKYRYKTIKKYVDLLLTILPFEKSWYAEKGVKNVRYVGNPLTGEVLSRITKKEFCQKHSLDETKPILALLPGSRRTEIERILPVLLDTAHYMLKRDMELQFVIPLASIRKFTEVQKIIEEAGKYDLLKREKLLIVKNETLEAVKAADAAAVTSGTATLETAIIGTPMAIVYKVSDFNFKILRHFISVEHIGLVNLIAGKKLAGEFIQNDFTAEHLGRELFRLLDSVENQKMREQLQKIKEKLGDGGASKKAAEAVLEALKN